MKKAIIMKNKLRFLDGSSPMPDNFDPTYEVWVRCNNLVLSWIINSVIPSISQSLIYSEVAADAWSDLKARFSPANRVRVSSLQRELYSFRQNSLSVNDFFTAIKSFWEELECNCLVRCECEATRNARKFKNEDLVLLFLTGLNDNYAAVRSQILLMEPFPDINAAFAMIIQHESLNELDHSDESVASINLTERRKFHNHSKGKPNYQNESCTFCGRSGHIVDICYKKNGYPPGFKFRDGSSPPKSAMANYVNRDDVVKTEAASSTAEQRVNSFTAEEYQALMSLLKTSSSMPNAGSKVNNIHMPSTSSYSAGFQGIYSASCNSISDGVNALIVDSGASEPLTMCVTPSTYSLITRNFNLISVSKVTQDLHCTFRFTDHICIIQNSLQRTIGSAKFVHGLYYLEGTSPNSRPSPGTVCNSINIPSSAVWHFRFGHASYSSSSRATHCFELLHMDLWGPYSTPTLHGHKYFLTIVDDFSRYTWIVLLKGKHEAASQIQKFILLVETQFECKIKTLKSDNGPEFSLQSFYASKGILHQTSCVHTPQQNGRVERKHQCILNVARALLFQSKLPPKFWGYDVTHAVYIMNRIPSSAIHDQLPYHLLHKSLPDLSSLRVFGCLCYISSTDVNMSKLQSRATKCIFLGYRTGVKGFVVLNLHNYQTSISKIVVFEETVFPYTTSNPNIQSWEYLDSTEPHSQQHTNMSSPTIDPILPMSLPQPSLDSPPSSDFNSIPPLSSPPPKRQSTRLKTRPIHLLDYRCNNVTSKTPYPISNYTSHSNLSSHQLTYTLSLLNDSEPSSYNEACKSDNWIKAMQNELHALSQNHTWTIVGLPSGVTPIGSKWVYKIKRHSDGTIERYKARLVAKGYNQREGIDFFETFSLVAKMTSIRTVFAIASINNWFVHQLDVNNAFLHGNLCEDVYMKIPQGLEGEPANKVCDLGCKPSTIPMDPNTKMHHDDTAPYTDISEYRTLVGKLLYLTTTRPDIAHPVQQLSQFSVCPTVSHYKAAHSSQILEELSWLRRSITGYCFFIGSSLVSWKSKKQQTVARSSSEAEYKALTATTCELQWLTYLLRDLQVTYINKPALFCDSQSARHIASNPVFHERTKHIDIDCHVVRERLQAELMKLLPISGHEQTTDIFTKALHPANFNRLISKLGLLDIYKP
ncbi:hypothetical protein TSUD_92220 [Trifolium subterraneum]|uniref:Integrase catalytic domain-containing protein n=1 Tax=Trifolium subterraneum TaxID=3900 RepID=A0A2Z6PC84_TRISU|nr:hypothetical protein TSUD_92220 [Trifolium subterraneum]